MLYHYQYSDLYSRNWAFISEELQGKLSNTCIFLAGSGLGSVIADIAVRTGFGRFIVADGDCVELSNLNRQTFYTHQIGASKSHETKNLIQRVNPSAMVDVIDEYLRPETLAAPISHADIIINTIDFDNAAFLDCNRKTIQQGKTVLFPINIGWGGALFIFSPESASLEETIGLSPDRDYSLETIKKAIVLKAMGDYVPEYLKDKLEMMENALPETWPYDPQIASAAHLTASLVVTSATAIVAEKNVRLTPDVIYCDMYSEVIAD